MKKKFKPTSRPRTLMDVLLENEELEKAGKRMPEELIKPHDHMDYYEGMDGSIPPAMVMDISKDK